ncbi:hypothetical protein ABW19_dt0208612 [Dactylella cylindrospora]|nr:hypothetical protein ABW19_dt0208612 [Dactylella cylindrospora]
MLSRTTPILRSLPLRTLRPNLSRRTYATHPETHHTPYAAATPGAKPTGEEKIPTWVYISTGTIFAVYALYGYIMPTTTTPLTRWLSRGDDLKKADEERTNRHTDFIEQASKDKHLFLGSDGSPTVPMRFPERFNISSPYNHSAGNSRGILMDKLEAHYEKENPKE